jgi:hypothetical protein
VKAYANYSSASTLEEEKEEFMVLVTDCVTLHGRGACTHA